MPCSASFAGKTSGRIPAKCSFQHRLHEKLYGQIPAKRLIQHHLQEKPQGMVPAKCLIQHHLQEKLQDEFLQSASFNIICRKSPNTCGGSWLSFDIKLNA